MKKLLLLGVFATGALTLGACSSSKIADLEAKIAELETQIQEKDETISSKDADLKVKENALRISEDLSATLQLSIEDSIALSSRVDAEAAARAEKINNTLAGLKVQRVTTFANAISTTTITDAYLAKFVNYFTVGNVKEAILNAEGEQVGERDVVKYSVKNIEGIKSEADRELLINFVSFLNNEKTTTLATEVEALLRNITATDTFEMSSKNLITLTNAMIAAKLIVISQDDYVITGYDGDLTDIIIPSKISLPIELNKRNRDVVITKIGADAFVDKKLEKVEILDGIVTIDFRAFQGTTNENTNVINTLILPKHVSYINGSAFQNNKITELVLPEGTGTIGLRAFHNNNISKLTFEPSTFVPLFGDYCFANNKIQELHIPATFANAFTNRYSFENNEIASIYIDVMMTEDLNLRAFRNTQDVSTQVAGVETKVYNMNGILKHTYAAKA